MYLDVTCGWHSSEKIDCALSVERKIAKTRNWHCFNLQPSAKLIYCEIMSGSKYSHFCKINEIITHFYVHFIFCCLFAIYWLMLFCLGTAENNNTYTIHCAALCHVMPCIPKDSVGAVPCIQHYWIVWKVIQFGCLVLSHFWFLLLSMPNMHAIYCLLSLLWSAHS